ncbi:MAG TPA: carboxypeptidase-like regulatory domain-containing protein, partial [Bryobacteraceae bacterium]|nr:carboxypeptidase-like regulatory domain-containing protein [Bryobacteraceae bacterium]
MRTLNWRPGKFPVSGTFLTLLVWLALMPTCFAEGSEAVLSGTVRDSTGLAVPGVQLELLHPETRVSRRVQTEGNGYYRYTGISAGDYELKATATGFSAAAVKAVRVQAGRSQTLNVVLSVATVSTSLEVTTAPLPIDTTTSTLQSTFFGRQLTAFPITGAGSGSLTNLSLLAPGVASSGGLGFGTGPSIGGQRPTSNSFTLEGLDLNNRATTGPLVSASNEAVAELTIQQNQFLPEFGHSSAGQFNSVLVRGSNAFHAALYEYFQNRRMNAVDESFRRQKLKESPRFDQN